jgi:non-specific protein-tyrosine kinase
VEILDKRKWLILLSMVVAAALTFGATRLIGSKWVATVRLVSEPTAAANEVDAQRGSPDIPDPEGRGAKAQAVVYATMVKSRQILRPALELLGETDLQQDFLQNLNQNITLDATGTRTFELAVYDNSPMRAMRLANGLADGLVSKNRDDYKRQAQEVVDMLTANLREAESRLGATRKRYEYYRTKMHVLSSQNDDLGLALGRLQATRQKRDEATEKLAEAQARLTETEREMAMTPVTIEARRAITPSPLVQELEKELATKERDLITLRARYTDDKIEVKQAIAAVNALDNRLKAEIARQPSAIAQVANPAREPLRQTVAQLRTEVSGYQAQLAALGSSASDAESEIRSSRDTEGPLGVLSRQLAQETETRANLAARLQNAHMALDGVKGHSPIMVLDRVSEFNPPINTKPGRTMKLLTLAVLCALLATSGLVIALESVDRRVKTVHDAELRLPAPVCAAIPAPQGSVTSAMLPRVTELQPLSLNSEAYRFLGLHLLTDRSRPVHSVMVLSSKAEQGSTNTVTNLGITLAQAGYRVVVVDANVRTPQVHSIFGLPNDRGLTTLLQDPAEGSLEDTLRTTSVEGLRVITAGPAPKNPWQLFRSSSLMRLSRGLQEVADYVLYDTPSALAFTDALNLTPVVDGAILCVRALEQPSGTEQRLLDFLRNAKVEILGVVLNDVPASLLESYQNYQRYYQPKPRPVPALTRGEQPSGPGASGGDPLLDLPSGNGHATSLQAAFIANGNDVS